MWYNILVGGVPSPPPYIISYSYKNTHGSPSPWVFFYARKSFKVSIDYFIITLLLKLEKVSIGYKISRKKCNDFPYKRRRKK